MRSSPPAPARRRGRGVARRHRFARAPRAPSAGGFARAAFLVVGDVLVQHLGTHVLEKLEPGDEELSARVREGAEGQGGCGGEYYTTSRRFILSRRYAKSRWRGASRCSASSVARRSALRLAKRLRAARSLQSLARWRPRRRIRPTGGGLVVVRSRTGDDVKAKVAAVVKMPVAGPVAPRGARARAPLKLGLDRGVEFVAHLCPKSRREFQVPGPAARAAAERGVDRCRSRRVADIHARDGFDEFVLQRRFCFVVFLRSPCSSRVPPSAAGAALAIIVEVCRVYKTAVSVRMRRQQLAVQLCGEPRPQLCVCSASAPTKLR